MDSYECFENRSPVAPSVTTASTKDHLLLVKLVGAIKYMVGIVVGDNGYQFLEIIPKLFQDFGILMQIHSLFTIYLKKSFIIWYNAMIKLPQARLLYQHCKPAIEPLFSLIKQIFDLQKENQLPYHGIDRVSAFLMISPLTVQVMIRDNFLNHRDWASTEAFLCALK